MARYLGIFTLASVDGRYAIRFGVMNGATYAYVFDRKIINQSGLVLRLFFPDSLRIKLIDFLSKIKTDNPKTAYPILIYQNNILGTSNAPFSITSRRHEFPVRLVDRNGLYKQWRVVKEGNQAKLIYETSQDGKNWKQESTTDIAIQTIKVIVGKDTESVVFLGLEFVGLNNLNYKIKFPIISRFNAKFPDEPQEKPNEYLSKLAVDSFIDFLQNQLPVIQANSLESGESNGNNVQPPVQPPSDNIDFFNENEGSLPDTTTNASDNTEDNKPDTQTEDHNQKDAKSDIDEEIPF